MAKRIEKIQRDFLFLGGGLNDETKMHLVEWDKVCSPMDEGGLGIRNIRKLNQALLGSGFGDLLMRRVLGGDQSW